MANKENTDKRDHWPSKWQRCCGRQCYTIDEDELGLDDGSLEEVFMGFDKRKKVRFAIDYKRINLNDVDKQSFSDSYWTVQSQAYVCDCQFKIPVPFFITLTYLSEEYLDKMYYVIPTNNTAKKLFKQYQKNLKGEWMTPLKFSQFQHLLRDISWNGEEIIDSEHTQAVGLPSNIKLNQLPNKKTIYPLPKLNFNSELVEWNDND